MVLLGDLMGFQDVSGGLGGFKGASGVLQGILAYPLRIPVGLRGTLRGFRGITEDTRG